ncbi:hypothetical protein [Capnocytophaga cynodegmi]|uniref:Uncharacterized protein n=1 Tax=Capnocytophaga cynodegmi TaxID=28189 RepID=A0A0B7HNN5_9FLAO|nr:hypothetical protein [Capnocytophaga cynodegmi]CEN39113.1 conserved hypothetical protein [Capnocytophaga cynodegmi]CEN42148.1 conserved hypothetical protein [Capnocytophaga cynodegmi]
MKSKRTSELLYLEKYRLVFANYDEISELKSELEEYGYDANRMNEGKQLYTKAQNLYDKNVQETSEAKEAYAIFEQAYEQLVKTYGKHRKAAKVALMHKMEVWETFSIKGETPRAYLLFIKGAKIFYNQAITHQEARPLLEKFKITDTIAQEQLSAIENIISLRAKYEKLSGESQQATQDKNRAFAEIDKWIREFYAVAKIALEDKPQLLEGIGISMRSQ